MKKKNRKTIKAWAVLNYRNRLKKSGGILYLIYDKKENVGWDKFQNDKIIPVIITYNPLIESKYGKI